jgi:hypothetical protein
LAGFLKMRFSNDLLWALLVNHHLFGTSKVDSRCPNQVRAASCMTQRSVWAIWRRGRGLTYRALVFGLDCSWRWGSSCDGAPSRDVSEWWRIDRLANEMQSRWDDSCANCRRGMCFQSCVPCVGQRFCIGWGLKCGVFCTSLMVGVYLCLLSSHTMHEIGDNFHMFIICSFKLNMLLNIQ